MIRSGGSREAAVRAGALAGIAGLAVFLAIHAVWIEPIWFIAPVGLVLAVAGGGSIGAAYAVLLPRLPRRPWTAPAVVASVAIVLLPAFVVGELLGPVYSTRPESAGALLISEPEALAIFVVGLLGTATGVGAALGWLVGRTRRAAGTMALAALVFALGPGHNIPLLGATPAVAKELVILAAVVGVSAAVLVEGHAWLARHPHD